MKNYFLLIIIMLTCKVVHSQVNIGVIELNNNYTATLNFSNEVDFVIIGNNPQVGMADSIPVFKYYGIFKSGKTVVLKAKDPLAPKTSITIKLDNGVIYYGLLQFGDDTKIFYDFSVVNKQEVKDSILEKAKGDKKMMNNLKSVLRLQNEYIEGVEENLLEVVVSNIRNDDKYTYFKISIKNESGNDYIIDNTQFKYVEGKNKGLFKKG